MASDRSWMHHRFDARNNITEEYKLGVQNFISVALRGEVDSKGRIRCPCKECGNSWSKLPDNVTYDLYRYGIMESYTTWIFHGEKHRSRVEAETSSGNFGSRDDDMYDAREMLRDFADAHGNFGNGEEEPNATAKKFYEMLDGASEPLYPDCSSSTTLSFVNMLLNFKNKHNCSNKGFDELLELIGSVLPEKHNLPETYYDVKKMISGLNMGYEKIDACENDCMLFYKENSKKTCCDICHKSRYKDRKDPKKKLIPQRIPERAYSIIGKVMTEVTNMVEAIEEIEVTHNRLDQEVQKLATLAYPNRDDPASKILWEEYIRIAAHMTPPLCQRYKKVILEATRFEAQMEVHEDEAQMEVHEDDTNAHLHYLEERYPL